MKELLIFIAGVCFVLLIAATPQGRSIMIMEPAQPISTVILYETWNSEKKLDQQAIQLKADATNQNTLISECVERRV